VCTAANVKEHELVIYYRNSRINSIISVKGLALPSAPDHAGSTLLIGSAVLSEIYVDQCKDINTPKLLAYMTFHEWMHNKLDADMSNRPVVDVHKNGGGGLANWKLSSKVSGLTTENIKIMAQVLGKKVKQYLHTILLG
jgi:hypothetical protein